MDRDRATTERNSFQYQASPYPGHYPVPQKMEVWREALMQESFSSISFIYQYDQSVQSTA